MTQRIPETFSILDWSRGLIMGNIHPETPTRTMMTRTKTATPNRTTSASRPSSENPTKTIDVSHTTPSIP